MNYAPSTGKYINKIWCKPTNILVQDNSDNTYQEDNYYCYNNGDKKKLTQWKKVDGQWNSHHLTYSSEFKIINNNVCKVITGGCDGQNPSEGCNIKCFADDKSIKVYTTRYLAVPS
jgi:hypothetical protein